MITETLSKICHARERGSTHIHFRSSLFRPICCTVTCPSCHCFMIYWQVTLTHLVVCIFFATRLFHSPGRDRESIKFHISSHGISLIIILGIFFHGSSLPLVVLLFVSTVYSRSSKIHCLIARFNVSEQFHVT